MHRFAGDIHMWGETTYSIASQPNAWHDGGAIDAVALLYCIVMVNQVFPKCSCQQCLEACIMFVVTLGGLLLRE